MRFQVRQRLLLPHRRRLLPSRLPLLRLLLSLVPDVEAGRFFSLMVLSSRAAAVVGPFVWAFAVDGLTPIFGRGVAYRAGVVTVALGMSLALWTLRRVPNNFAGQTAK